MVNEPDLNDVPPEIQQLCSIQRNEMVINTDEVEFLCIRICGKKNLGYAKFPNFAIFFIIYLWSEIINIYFKFVRIKNVDG